MNDVVRELCEAIGRYGVQCSETKELAMPADLKAAIDRLQEQSTIAMNPQGLLQEQGAVAVAFTNSKNGVGKIVGLEWNIAYPIHTLEPGVGLYLHPAPVAGAGVDEAALTRAEDKYYELAPFNGPDELREGLSKCIAVACNYVRTELPAMVERVEKAEAELAACRKDAERYRWLRDNFRFANDSVWEIWFNAGVVTRKADSELLDSTIDAAQETP